MTGKVILELGKWDDRRYRVECLSGGRWRFSASFITRGGGNRRGREGTPRWKRERQNHRHKGGIMIVPVIILGAALAYIVTALSTWVVQWGLTEITGQDMPFWPIFWILVVLSVVCGGTSKALN